jgi:hypothetical protein
MKDKLKISLISFDNWNYDKEIVIALSKKNIEATHINIGAYKHKNLFERLKNLFFKIFLNKNLKFKKRQEYILKTLTKLGHQDQILVLNPDLIDYEYHKQIKQHTNRYITYLYDSIARSMYPIEHLLNGVFDDIYSFDKIDVENYNFKKINNYIYFDKQEIVNQENTKYKLISIASFDKRFNLFNKIANQLSEMNYNFLFIFVSRNINYKLLKHKLNNFNKKQDALNKSIYFQSKKIPLSDIKKFYNQSSVLLDLVQDNQTGLSFRVFEALGLQKKLITNNKTIINYDFYDPKNIMVLKNEKLNFNTDFFTDPYNQLPDTIYNQYTIENWVKVVFELED